MITDRYSVAIGTGAGSFISAGLKARHAIAVRTTIPANPIQNGAVIPS
ncbi:hypothetical protein [Pseudonocardia sp. TRM90224]|nr:hypothetical protein [Pseudonocardia sp. TRM90224]